MASQLYDSVTRNDAKRDALRNKTPAKPGMHPRSDIDTARRAKKAKDRRAEIAARHSGNGSTQVAAKKSPPRGSASAASASEAGLGGGGGGFGPSNAAKKITEQPKATRVAVRSGDNPPSPRSALGPQRPAGGSGSFIGSVADYVGKTVKSNQARYDNAVKDRIRSDREAGPSTPRGQAAAATAPKPGATTKPAPTKTANPGKPKGGKVAVARRSAAPANPPAVPPSKPTAFGSPSTAPVTPKRDVAALQARSKQSLADSQAAAAAHKNGPGGGASTVLAAYRGDNSHFKKREK